MNDYTGKTCPFCKTEIKGTDDIVICSDCNMPHHKSCWITNQGCTTFGCSGTIQNAGGGANNEQPDEAAPAPQAVQTQEPPQAVKKFCTKCGNRFNEGDLFCGTCGSPLNAAPAAVNTQNHAAAKPVYSEPQNNHGYKKSNYRKDVLIEYDDDDYYNSIDACYDKEYNNPSGTSIFNDKKQNYVNLAYIGENIEYYQKKFNDMEQFKKTVSWNWCAFFFAPYWLIYRKLYIWGFGILAIEAVSYFTKYTVLSFLICAIFILSGMFGNSIYKSRIDKLARDSLYLSEEAKNQYIIKNQGVNLTATILVVLLYNFALILTNFL